MTACRQLATEYLLFGVLRAGPERAGRGREVGLGPHLMPSSFSMASGLSCLLRAGYALCISEHPPINSAFLMVSPSKSRMIACEQTPRGL